jgi:hypothetical protein
VTLFTYSTLHYTTHTHCTMHNFTRYQECIDTGKYVIPYPIQVWWRPNASLQETKTQSPNSKTPTHANVCPPLSKHKHYMYRIGLLFSQRPSAVAAGGGGYGGGS